MDIYSSIFFLWLRFFYYFFFKSDGAFYSPFSGSRGNVHPTCLEYSTMISLSCFVKITWSSTRRISRSFSASKSLKSWILNCSAMCDLSTALCVSYRSTLHKRPKTNILKIKSEFYFAKKIVKKLIYKINICVTYAKISRSLYVFIIPRLIMSFLAALCECHHAFFSL